MTPAPNPPAPTTYPDAVVAGAREMFEHDCKIDPSLTFKTWDELTKNSRDKYCSSFAAGLEAMWQPIETAPKDGTRIRLAWSPEDWTTADGWWRDDKWLVAAVFYNMMLPKQMEVREYHVNNPTHWQPLPHPRTTGDAA